MKRKQKLSFERFYGLLSNKILVDEKVDYLSYQSQESCKNVTAYEAYQLMISRQPKWLAGLFKIRDFLGKRVGINPINRFNKLEETELDIGSKVHFSQLLKTKGYAYINNKGSLFRCSFMYSYYKN